VLVIIAAAGAIGIIAQVRKDTRIRTARRSTSVGATSVKNPVIKPADYPAYDDREFDGATIVKTDAEWKRQLTKAQFHILREEGTETPFVYPENHEHGIYYCAACGLALFRSENKFDSETGWPSFYQPIFPKNVIERIDKKLGETRTEIECARCGSHLGHVFDDGPKPTGLRYCMNALAMKFRKK